jgi:hypothetical protein
MYLTNTALTMLVTALITHKSPLRFIPTHAPPAMLHRHVSIKYRHFEIKPSE